MNIFRERIAALRRLMEAEGIDHYLITTNDFHASEYVGDHFKCREYMSGFTGSAGTLLVSMDTAGLWTDGRYFLQAETQLEGTGICLFKSGLPGTPKLEDYLAEQAKTGDTLGYDGRTVTSRTGQALRRALAKKQIRFHIDVDLVGEVWTDRPHLSAAPIWLLPEGLTGKTRSEKLAAVREQTEAPLLLTSLDDIAWLFNFRGDDILYTPVALACALIAQDEAVLYIAPEAVSKDVQDALEADRVVLRPYLQVYQDISDQFGSEDSRPLQMDPARVNETLARSVRQPLFRTDPTLLAKAIKNPVEIRGEQEAHLKDGIALTKTICWLKGEAAAGRHHALTELEVAERLLKLRQKQPDFLSLSFESIVATGDHGAIIHYAPSPETDRYLEDGFLLMDTGGQYLQGTTDVTRTLLLGKGTDEQKRCYTAVLRGHLAVATARFPEGTSGNALDPMARRPLWDLGLDYEHGTGHGVGCLLSVHEGPNAIRKSGTGTPLEEGMITSNEPGVYLDGRFGIRLENLVLCRAGEETFLGRRFLHFETLTLAPFDRDAILPELLTDGEREALNAYHARVFRELAPYLDEEERNWLKAETAPL